MNPDSRRPPPNQSAPAVRGRPFAPGNPGRKVGSLNRTTRIAARLLDAEAEAIVRKGIELALAGDSQMLKFFLSRILPRERTIPFDLSKLEFAEDIVDVTADITCLVADGIITPSEGAAVATIVEANRKAIDLVDVVNRLASIKEKMKSSA